MKSFLRLFILLFFVITNSSASDELGLKPPIRAILVVPKNMSVEHAVWLASEAKEHKFNTILFRISRNHGFENLAWSSDDVDWTKSDLEKWIAHTKNLGFEIIPELKLLSHQEKFFGKDHPNLMFNTVTYDPSKNEVYELIFPLLNEIIEMFDPKAIHIGHDEIAGHSRRSRKRWLTDGEPTLPAELFLQHLNKVKNYLKDKNVQTWIWGDMLLSPREFSDMLPRHLHGNFPGYGQELRKIISKDILIVDWHNFDEGSSFSSTRKLVSEGFPVIGSSWDQEATMENFAQYASDNEAEGMLFTPWGMFLKNRKSDLEYLISEYGELFLNHFPDKR